MKGGDKMNKTISYKFISLLLPKIINILSGNVLGDALLTNRFYEILLRV